MRIITNNFGLKLLSLVLAVLTSAYVINEVNYPIPETVYLPLQARGLADDMVLVSSIQPSIQVKVRGPFRVIRRLQAVAPPATLNLSAYKEPGPYTAPVHLPDLGQVLITGQQFEAYSVNIDRRAQVKKQLRIDSHGELSEHFQVGSEVLEPDSVRISGPASLVESVALVQVEPDLSRLDRRISDKLEPLLERLSVKLYDRDGHLLNQQLLRIEPEAVDYTMTPVPVGSIKVLKVLPDYVGDPADGFTVESLSPSVLYVRLDAAVVPEGVSSVSTSPVDVSRKDASFSAAVQLVYPFRLPEGSDAPTDCNVQVEIVPLTAEKGVIDVPIELFGKNQHYEYQLEVSKLQLVPETAVPLTDEEMAAITARIDVGGLNPGDYRLSPQLSLPLALERARILPPTVSLRITQATQTHK